LDDAHKVKASFIQRPLFAILLIPLLVLLLNFPFLKAGFFADDFFFLNALRSDTLAFSHWQGMWSIEDYTSFDVIWWKDPDWHGKFFRPVASLVIEGSIRAFGETAFPLHLLAILLHAGIGVSLYWLVRQLTGRHGLAFLAALLYVACEDHYLTLGWVATISDVLCVQFILLGLLFHVRWLRRRRPPALIISLVMTVIAMGCKETGIAAPAALMLLTWFLPNGSNGLSPLPNITSTVRAGLRDHASWVPQLALALLYLGFYKGLELGAGNNLLYTDPLGMPVAYLEHLVYHLPFTWLGTLTAWPLFVTMFWESTLVPMAVAGVVVFLMWAAALWCFRRYPIVLWAVILYHAAVLPQLSTDANERNLYFPMIPAAVLIALVISSIGPLARRLLPDLPTRPRWTRIVGWFAVGIVLVPGLLLSATRPHLLVPGLGRMQRELLTAIPHIEENGSQDVVILNTSGQMLTLYTRDVINYHSDRPLDVWPLSSGNGVFSLEKTGDSSFVIHNDRHGWLDNWYARVLRTGDHLKPGRWYDMPIFTATLIEMTADGRDALAVRFDFKRSLDDAGLLFLRWDGSSYEPLDIAAMEIGESAELFDSSDIFNSMQ